MVKQRVTRGLPAADNAEEAEEYQADLDPDDRGFCLKEVYETVLTV